MRRTKLCVLVLAIFSMTFAQQASADRSESETTARQAIVRCGGTNFLRLGDAELHFASYVLRNFDSRNSIVINRMKFFDANGGTLFDTEDDGFPPANNQVLGPTNQTLGPNQTAQFDTNGNRNTDPNNFVPILPFLNQPDRPIQLEIQWSASRSVLTLDVVTTRIVRQRNSPDGTVGEESSRSVIGCRTIALRK